jgi:hypothetical protein
MIPVSFAGIPYTSATRRTVASNSGVGESSVHGTRTRRRERRTMLSTQPELA